MQKSYQEALPINEAFWREGTIDTRFRVGDQSLYDEYDTHNVSMRGRGINFNLIAKHCNVISGHQRRNRKSLVVVPVNHNNETATDQHSKTLFSTMHQADMDHVLSTAFDNSLTTGLSLISLWMDFRDDPINGDIKADVMDFNAVLLDPYFRKRDLSDCGYIYTRQMLTKNEIKTLLHDRAAEVEKLSEGASSRDKFILMPEALSFSNSGKIPYDEFWYKDIREKEVLVDSTSGEVVEWVGKETVRDDFLEKYPEIVLVKQLVQTTKLAIAVQGEIFYHGMNPMGIDEYPFVPVLANYTPELPSLSWRIQGVVRNLRDPQWLYTHSKVVAMDISESTISSGWKYKPNSLINPRDIFLQGQGKSLAFKDAASLEDAQKIFPTEIPQSFILMSKSLAEDIQNISGVNEELLGTAEDDKSGVLSMLRQSAGLTTLQGVFDNLDYAYRQVGRVFLKLIQANFSPGKIKQITQQEPAREFYSKAFNKYDTVVEEGANTSTQKQVQFRQRLMLKELGYNVSMGALLETSSIQGKDRLIEEAEQDKKEQKELQEKQQQAQMVTLQAQVKDLEARALANEGLGKERLSRIPENLALAKERVAEAKKDRDLGTLDIVKAMKELEGMDLEQVEKLLQLANLVSENQAKEQEKREKRIENVGSAKDLQQTAPRERVPLEPAYGQGESSDEN